MPRSTEYPPCPFADLEISLNTPEFRDSGRCLCSVPSDVARCCKGSAKELVRRGEKDKVATAIAGIPNDVGLNKNRKAGLQMGIK